MSKFLSLLAFFAFVAFVSSMRYEFNISLAPIKNPDGDLNGTLKAYVQTVNSNDFLRLNETSLRQGSNYTSKVDYAYAIHQIQNVTFQWTLSSPLPPKFWIRKPSIYLRRLSVVPVYIQNPTFRQQETKHFCPHSETTGIKHKETLPLKRC